MGARRRGPRRHSHHRGKGTADDQPEDPVTPVKDLESPDRQSSGGPEVTPPPVPAPKRRAALGLKPSPEEVIRAVESLYADQLKPFGRILRKRIAERSVAEARAATGGAAAPDVRGCGDVSEPLPDVDIKHLRETCEGHGNLCVEPEEGGDWSAVLLDREPLFVNVYSPDDPYTEEMWRESAEYFEGLDGPQQLLPGGRYSCAQALLARGLPFFAGRTLGEICHFVQLAISKRKILGYSNGAVVPYNRSQSMVKERCAEWQQPCLTGAAARAAEPNAAPAAATAPSAGMPLADWETARACLREILDSAAEPDQGPPSIPLSNVKRLFRSRYHLELSETTLGHSKLSELLQDERFSDVCTVQLQGHGYIVVQTQPAEDQQFSEKKYEETFSKMCAFASKLDYYEKGFGVVEAKQLAEADLGGAISIADSLLPGFSTSAPLDDASLGGEPRRLEFCPGEPLCLEDAGLLVEGEPCGPLPFPTPTPSPIGAGPSCFRWPALSLSPSTLSKDGCLGSMVQNTFIHAAPPPPTPPPGARQRARSLPKDVGSAKSEWEAACHALGFMPRPASGAGDSTAASTADGSGSSARGCAAGPPAPLSPAPSSERERANADGCSSPAAGSAPMKVPLRDPFDHHASEPWPLQLQPVEPLPDFAEDAAAPQRIQFCPDEPLSLEDAGIFIDRAPPGLSAVPAAPRWPMLSPSVRAVGSMIHNTFIGAPPTPVTPVPGAMRRSRSLPEDVGCCKGGWETPRGAGRSRAPGAERATAAGYPPSLVASPGPAFVPPSPALTASPLPLYSTGGGYAPVPPLTPQRVLRLAELI